MKLRNVHFLFLISRALCSPLEALFTLLIFIVSKELHASLFALTILACSKPIVSLFAYYLNAVCDYFPKRARAFLFSMNFLGCAPCLLFPFVDNAWFFVFSFALFTMTVRAVYPIWCEALKSNLGVNSIAKPISQGTSINYFIIMVIPVLASHWMDQDAHLWKYLFFSFALLQMFNTLVLALLPMNLERQIKGELSLGTIVLDPWKNGWMLLRENRDFAKYLLMFFLGGAGIIATQPLLPNYFQNSLGLSYTQMTLAFSFCKGISFLVSSPIWAKKLNTMSLYRLNYYVNLFSCIFFAGLLAAPFSMHWLIFAYLMYGIMQAGCELSWNASGPIFSKHNDSTLFSSMNLALVGIRGTICPALGQLLFVATNAQIVFIIAGGVCFVSLLYAKWLDTNTVEFSEKNSEVFT